MVHLKSIWELIWNPFGVCFGVHVGPSGVHFGIHFGSMLSLTAILAQIPSGPDFWTPGTDLGASLGPHVGPMLAPCWRRSGVLRGPWAFLGRSKGHLEFILDQHGKEDEKERRDFREKKKTLQNTVFFNCF